MSTVKTLQVSFSLPVSPAQVSNWRGAFIQMADWRDSLLHNHNNTSALKEGAQTPNRKEKNYFYRYPLIQYRSVAGRASLFAVNEGVKSLQNILAKPEWYINWKGRKQLLQIQELKILDVKTELTTERFIYRVHEWLALNEENFKRYNNTGSLIERISFLEKILTNHLLAFCHSVHMHPENPVKVVIRNMQKPRLTKLRRVRLIAFNVEFSVNLKVPEAVSIGKSVRLGYGVIEKMR